MYRARTADGRHVALKKIHIFDMMDAKSRNKCLREVLMLQTISKHENLIAYLDAFIEDNELMIVFEWAENGDLRRLLRKTTKPFEERQVWNYFLQVAGAIAHMHEQRMMHRDIKPANIFISASNVLKLGDLGLGRVFSNESVEAFSKVIAALQGLARDEHLSMLWRVHAGARSYVKRPVLRHPNEQTGGHAALHVTRGVARPGIRLQVRRMVAWLLAI